VHVIAAAEASKNSGERGEKMNKFKNYAVRRPFLFGFTLIFLYVIFGYLTYPINFLFPESEIGQLYSSAVIKLTISLIFLAILWVFGWIRASGLTRFGNIKVWPVIVIILVYHMLVNLRFMTGDFAIVFPDSPLKIANLIYYFPASLMEELMFRGLTLLAMVFAWGGTKKGLVKAVLLSSLLFGLIHLFNVVELSIEVVFLEVFVAAMLGFLWAAIVLDTRSLWIAVILHWLTNAAVNLKLVGINNFRETFTMHIWRAVFFIPLVVYGAYLVWKLPVPFQDEKY
jgi:membrane protease YdiL (CAAX protease family)